MGRAPEPGEPELVAGAGMGVEEELELEGVPLLDEEEESVVDDEDELLPLDVPLGPLPILSLSGHGSVTVTVTGPSLIPGTSDLGNGIGVGKIDEGAVNVEFAGSVPLRDPVASGEEVNVAFGARVGFGTDGVREPDATTLGEASEADAVERGPGVKIGTGEEARGKEILVASDVAVAESSTSALEEALTTEGDAGIDEETLVGRALAPGMTTVTDALADNASLDPGEAGVMDLGTGAAETPVGEATSLEETLTAEGDAAGTEDETPVGRAPGTTIVMDSLEEAVGTSLDSGTAGVTDLGIGTETPEGAEPGSTSVDEALRGTPVGDGTGEETPVGRAPGMTTVIEALEEAVDASLDSGTAGVIDLGTGAELALVGSAPGTTMLGDGDKVAAPLMADERPVGRAPSAAALDEAPGKTTVTGALADDAPGTMTPGVASAPSDETGDKAVETPLLSGMKGRADPVRGIPVVVASGKRTVSEESAVGVEGAAMVNVTESEEPATEGMLPTDDLWAEDEASGDKVGITPPLADGMLIGGTNVVPSDEVSGWAGKVTEDDVGTEMMLTDGDSGMAVVAATTGSGTNGAEVGKMPTDSVDAPLGSSKVTSEDSDALLKTVTVTVVR